MEEEKVESTKTWKIRVNGCEMPSFLLKATTHYHHDLTAVVTQTCTRLGLTAFSH